VPFKCNQCGFTVDTKTQDGLCPKPNCDMGVLMLCSEIPTPTESKESEIIEGLCLLVCDISGSMSNSAFSESPVVKLALVVDAIKTALKELRDVANAARAFVGIIAFGKNATLITNRRGAPFIMSAKTIDQEFPEDLGKYLRGYFEEDRKVDRNATDINAALKTAFDVYNGALQGDLSEWGIPAKVDLMKNAIAGKDRMIEMPNARVLIYSDGQHTGADDLHNPFEGVPPVSPLITAFIGDESRDEDSRKGADQMKSLATVCQKHGFKAYFLINTLQRHVRLRGLFRMTSGASGFCHECLKEFLADREVPH